MPASDSGKRMSHKIHYFMTLCLHGEDAGNPGSRLVLTCMVASPRMLGDMFLTSILYYNMIRNGGIVSSFAKLYTFFNTLYWYSNLVRTSELREHFIQLCLI